MKTKLRNSIRLLAVLCLSLALLTATLLHMKTYQASKKAQAISQKANQNKDYLYFKSKGKTKANILFYQGALVEENSYSVIGQGLAKVGYNVYLLKTPLNLPVLANKKSLNIIRKRKLTNVYLAGHSLGGVIASQDVKESSDIQGLILLASYPSEKIDLSKSHLKVLSITASQDKVLKWDNYKAAKKRLPRNTSYVTISNGNHGGFGSYGHQAGDGKAKISNQKQNQEIVTIIDNFLAHTKSPSNSDS